MYILYVCMYIYIHNIYIYIYMCVCVCVCVCVCDMYTYVVGAFKNSKLFRIVNFLGEAVENV